MLNFSVPVAEKTDVVMAVDDGLIRVAFVNLGEGCCGDYDPEDSDDENLLRYDVELHDTNSPLIETYDEDGWGPVRDASFCTLTPADTEKGVLAKLLLVILNKLRDPLLKGEYPKDIMESLSWICPEDVQEGGKYANEVTL